MPTTRDQHGHIVSEARLTPPSPDLADAVVEGVQAAFGALSLGLDVALRTLQESPATLPRRPGPRIPVSEVADVLVGTAWGAARLSGRLAATGARMTAPALGLVLRPPLLPRRLQPAQRVQLMTERWKRDRPAALRTLGRWSAAALPGAVDAALDQVDVREASTVVLDRVDLTRIATTLLERLDVDAVAAQLLSQLQVEAVAAQVLDQLRLDQLAAQVLDQLRVDQLAMQAVGELRVDELAAQVLDQLDLTQLVLDRVDLQRVVAGALDRLDLTAIVVEQVDLGDVVAAALQRVDLTQIVMGQVDLIGVAQYVVDGIDLPEIIRDSTGSVASEAVVGLRMQGIDADVLVGRVVDRMLRRRRERRTEEAPEPPDSSDASDASGVHPAGTAE